MNCRVRQVWCGLWVAVSALPSWSCIALYDFDYRGAGGATSGVSNGGGGSISTGGASSCVLPAADFADAAEPWVSRLGPIRATPALLGMEAVFVDVELVGDKIVFGIDSFQNGQALVFDEQPIQGGETAFVVGWLDDGGGVAPEAWPLTSLLPMASGNYASSLDVASWRDGKVLVGLSDGESRALLLELDLCTREERVLIDCQTAAAGTISFAFVDADGEADRIAFSLYEPSEIPRCTFSPDLASCPVAAGETPRTELMVFDGLAPGGKCSTKAVAGASYVRPKLTPGGVLLTGNYEGSLFDAPDLIQTRCEACGANTQCLSDFACVSNKNDAFFARFEANGSELELKRAVDLGGTTNAAAALPAGADGTLLGFSVFPRLPYPPRDDPGAAPPPPCRNG